MAERSSLRRRGHHLVAVLVAIGILATAQPAVADLAPDDGSPRLAAPGFLLKRGRVAATIELPDAGTQNLLIGVNDRDEIVGKYDDTDGRFHGFYRDRRGRSRRIDVPGAISTYAMRINNRHEIVGAYNTEGPQVGAPGTKGYLWRRGRFTTIAYPGASYTQAFGINRYGVVVGEYMKDGTIHGFRWRRGRFTTIDVPGFVGTSLADINDRGDVVGVGAGKGEDGVHGFVRRRGGKVTKFDALGARYTVALGINNRREVVGYGIDDLDLTGARAFLAEDGGKGVITRISVRNAPRTIAGDINNRGHIVGNYENVAVTGAEAAPTSTDATDVTDAPDGMESMLPMPML